MYDDSETFVFIEPGKDEQFLTEAELRSKLEALLLALGDDLPRDVAKFATREEALDYLVNAVCELEMDKGTVQWYSVRLEA